MNIEPLTQRILVLRKITGEPIVSSFNFLKYGKVITFVPSCLVHGKNQTKTKSWSSAPLCSLGHSYILQRYLTIKL